MEIWIKHIKKKYKKNIVLKDIDFRVSGDQGKCIGILGTNGCGKSTLLSILAGVIKADDGEFLIDNSDILKHRSANGSRIGYVPQKPPLIEELTALDNLKLWYCDSSLDMKEELHNGVLCMLGINDFIKTPVYKMSGGMKKRLSIGCAVANNPDILIMDEPGAALDLICKEHINTYIGNFKKSGGIIILATHEEREIEMCDVLYIMKDGKLELSGYDGDVGRLAKELV